MSTYRFIIEIETENEKEAREEFSEVFNYDLSIDNHYEVAIEKLKE